MEIKKKECANVLNFLIGEACLKTHKNGIYMATSSCEFFRGVNFHICALQHGDKIIKMMPSFVEDKLLAKVTTI